MLLHNLDTSSYTFRRYIVSSGDAFSAKKAVEFENRMALLAENENRFYGAYDIKFVPRARRVHQSLVTTPVSALRCLWACLKVLRESPSTESTMEPRRLASPYPDLILTNGPATATILIFASLLLRFASMPGTKNTLRCIYVESWARVKTLSLSAKLLLMTGACERVLVQWRTLEKRDPGIGRGAEYRGSLVG